LNGTTEELAEKVGIGQKSVPQGLKPGDFAAFSARLKVVP
jgi:hypothetical protein